MWRYKYLVRDDEDAIAKARVLFRQRGTGVCGFELWQDGRYVHCENSAAVVDGAVVIDGGADYAIHTALSRPSFGALSHALTRRSRYV